CTLPSLSRAHNPGYVKCHRYIQQALFNFCGTGILPVADIGAVFYPKRIHAQNNILNYLNLFRDRPV
ncbi:MULTISPECIES: hypothetical protein, partial [unclassified Microcoleus]|uniref:hypothetical protein n=1 Tax=unclassified Microcoleus TaxID=2642155 RepID=UPI002FD33B85